MKGRVGDLEEFQGSLLALRTLQVRTGDKGRGSVWYLQHKFALKSKDTAVSVRGLHKSQGFNVSEGREGPSQASQS